MKVTVEEVAAKMVENEQREHYALSDGSRVSPYTLRTLRLVYGMSDKALADIFGVNENEIEHLSDAALCLAS